MMFLNMLKVVALLVLVNCCVFNVALCHNIDNIRSHNAKILSPKQSSEERERFRRAINSEKRTSCSSRDQCTGNQTVLETTSKYYNCYCDNACYETFLDCCPDFVKTCGDQKETDLKTLKNLWQCVDLHLSHFGNGGCTLYGPEGIWMIHNCPTSWPRDETSSRCQNAPEKFSYPLGDFLPVVGHNKLTYRNKHCAICNGEQQYITWEVIVYVEAFLTPPADYSFDDKMRFILANGGSVKNIKPDSNTPRRYCAEKKYKDTCSNMTHPDYNSCVKGPVETVGKLSGWYYKNKACAYCNGETDVMMLERSSKICHALPQSLSQTLSLVLSKGSQESSSNTRVVENCPTGFVYDETLGYCREGLVTSTDDTLSHVFLVALWFQPGSIKDLPPVFAPTERSRDLVTNLTQHLKSALMENFNLGPNQVTELRFHRQDYESTVLVSTFRLTLTPYQDFILANQNHSADLNISSNSLKFLELLKFTSNFTLYSGTFRFPVIKLTTQQLACFQGMTLQPHEYQIDKKTGNILQKTTGRNFSQNDYTILERDGGNITICRKLVLSNCNNGSYVPLNETEYFIYKNLTVFHYATNRTSNFGEYQIIESSFNTSKLDSPQNTSLPRNSRIAVCLPLRGTFTKTVVHSTEETSLALRILTLIGFSISVFFLLLLLVTYGIFKELRSLPGLNLMSLSVSMLLSYAMWLIGTAHFQDTKVCKVLGILEHYLFLVSFMAMSVISYHSCVVFSRPFGTSSNSTRRFVKYSTLVWLTPALFVAVCVILDQTETTFDIYGDKCWLETNEAVLYLFLLPVAVLLVYNIYTFIKTAFALSRSNKDARILQQDRKQNLLICTKLATLVGFPWIFAFFGVIFPDVEAFEYLFVIFVCFQGFYIGIAFVLKKKTRQLYRKWWKNKNTTTAGSTQPKPTFQMS